MTEALELVPRRHPRLAGGELPGRDAHADTGSEDDICWGGRNWAFASDAQRQWLEAMAGRGWTVPDWPKDYGGGGLSADETRVLRQEMARIGARSPLDSFGISMLGPALLNFGTEEQKRHYLPPDRARRNPLVPGLFGAGRGVGPRGPSDQGGRQGRPLAGQRPEGVDQLCRQGRLDLLPVRTSAESKQGGISFLLFDMETPGVSTRPILLISGNSPFCETFFDDVKVPKEQIVGEVNRGWDVAKYLLGHEREMISGMGLGGGGSLGAAMKPADPLLRAEIAAFDVDALAFSAMSERFTAMWKAGEAHPASPSMMKYAGTELNKRRNELVMAAGGSDALEWESERSKAPRDWLRSKGNSIEGGTSEIQLNIVAKHILRLPGA